MNGIDRATAQLIELEPVWKFVIKDVFKVEKPYRLVETDTEVIIVRPKVGHVSWQSRFVGYFKRIPNEYGIELSEDEEIESVISISKLLTEGFLYYDDPDETDQQRRDYINKHMPVRMNMTFFNKESSINISSASREIISIEYVKKEKQFNFIPNTIE